MKTLISILALLLTPLADTCLAQTTKGQSPEPCKQSNGDICFKNTCDKPITVNLRRGQIDYRTIDLLKGQESCMYDLQEGGYTYVAREKKVGSGWNSQGAAGMSTPFTNEVKVKKCEELKVELPNFLE